MYILKIVRVEPLVWDSKSLGFHSLHSVDGITPDELFNHMKDVIQALSQNPGFVIFHLLYQFFP